MECLESDKYELIIPAKYPIPPRQAMPTTNQLLQAFNRASNFVEGCRFIDNGGEIKETLSEGNVLT